jgi:hypothetical protein
MDPPSRENPLIEIIVDDHERRILLQVKVSMKMREAEMKEGK